MRQARFVYGIALEDAEAMSDDGQCVPFKIAPRMFSSGNKLTETQGELEILNAGSAVSEGEEVAAIQDLSGFWTRLETGGAAGQYITFKFVDEGSSSSSGSVSSSESDEVPDDCASRSAATGPFFGRVEAKACGMGAVPGEDENGLIELQDDLGLLDNRDYRDIAGRIGFAVRMQQEASSSVSSSSSASECYWMIVYVNFWRVVRQLKDVIFTEDSIIKKYHNITVWDNCDLPDEVIEGTDCPEPGSGSSSSSTGGV